jgi:polysaccharide pyruvyl transferase WcaK-like protein
MQATAPAMSRQTPSSATAERTAAPSFALATPYHGGNLGDGAIMDAVISNIRRRLPDAPIYGITMNPVDTLQRHGIQSFPLYANTPPDYWLAPQDSIDSMPAENHRPSGKNGVVGRVAKWLARGGRAVARLLLPRGWPWFIRTEVSHVLQGFYFLKNVDYLIVNGGGQLSEYWGGRFVQPYALMKWAILARLRGARPIFLSVGFGSLDSRLSRFFVRRALSLAAYRSYRDPGSRDLIKRAGFRRNDLVYPDLAYSLPLDGYRLDPAGRPAGRVVGVSPFGHRHPQYPLGKTRDYSAYEAYIRKMVAIVQWLVTKGYRVSMWTSVQFDPVAVDDLWDKLTAESSPEIMKSIERHAVTTVRGYLEHAAAVDVMVASRLHGVLLAQLVGTPALALSYERKVDVQMELVGQSEFCLGVDHLQVAEFQECFNRLEASLDSAREQIQTRFADYRAQLDVQYDAILQPESRP